MGSCRGEEVEGDGEEEEEEEEEGEEEEEVEEDAAACKKRAMEANAAGIARFLHAAAAERESAMFRTPRKNRRKRLRKK
jgi:hypothetical protein